MRDALWPAAGGRHAHFKRVCTHPTALLRSRSTVAAGRPRLYFILWNPWEAAGRLKREWVNFARCWVSLKRTVG